MRRWGAAVAAVAAIGVGSFAGAVALSAPALAAGTLEIKIDQNNVQAKVGDKVSVGFTLTNGTDAPVNGVVVGMTAPSNSVVDQADNPGCTVGGGGRAVSCRSSGTLAAGRSAKGRFVITAKTAGDAAGRIQVQNGKADSFNLRAVGGPSPSSTKSAKPTKSSSASASETPALPDVTLAPPEAGNGVAVQATSAGATTRTAGEGGMSVGIWVGIVAIIGALGLVGSLFYFRRKDRDDLDTGMHPLVPAPAGFPSGGYAPPPAQPRVYGSPAAPPPYVAPPGSFPPAGPTQIVDPTGSALPPSGPTQVIHPTSGPPTSGPTQVVNPAFGPPPSGPTQIIGPGAPGQPPAPGGDQTVVFRRPDQP
jgi:hypothetical protein